MKNTLKKVMGKILIITLLVGIMSASTQIVQAASKLTEADFEFTGNDKSHMNGIIDIDDQFVWRSIILDGDKNPKKSIKTNRGITLTSTKKQVFNKYGKVLLEKVGKETLLYESMIFTTKDQRKIVKNEKCAVY